METLNPEKTCQSSPKCPIYSGVLKGMTYTASAYRQLYCDAGSTGWNKCRRFQVKMRTGKCPENILPNALKSVDEIIKQHGLTVLP
jgi:hypothetical protein